MLLGSLVQRLFVKQHLNVELPREPFNARSDSSAAHTSRCTTATRVSAGCENKITLTFTENSESLTAKNVHLEQQSSSRFICYG